VHAATICEHCVTFTQHLPLDDGTAAAAGQAILLSRVNYCNSLLINMTNANFDQLQNRLVRAVMKLSYQSHVSAAGERLH